MAIRKQISRSSILKGIKMKRKIFYVMTLAAVLSLSACSGRSENVENKSATPSELEETDAATPSEISKDNPEIKKLESLEVPDEPKLKDMGTVTLPDLETISVEVSKKQEVTDKTVDSEISYLLSQYPEEKDSAAESGDIVNIDYTGTIDGKEFDGGSAEGYDLTLGSGSFVEGFEDQLIGHKKGDTITVKVTFPPDYDEAVAGKDAEFSVTINSVKEVPSLTDEWVKKNKEALKTDAETADEFSREKKLMLQAQAEYQYESSIDNAALQKIIDGSVFNISDEMNNYAYAYVVNQTVGSYKDYGYESAADLINAYGYTLEDFESEMKENALNLAKQEIIVKTIADKQGIRVTDDMMNDLADKISALTGEKMNKIRLIELYGGDNVKSEALYNEVFNYIRAKITINETDGSDTATASASEIQG